MKIFDLLHTKYIEFDSAIKSYLSKTLSNYGSNYGNNTILGQFISVLGGVTQNIMLYIEDALVEQNKYTAQRKKSIYSLAQLSGYNPSLGKAACCNVKLSFIPSSHTNLNILISNHQRLICSQNGLIYNIILPQESLVFSLDRDNSYKYLQVVEGNFETQKFLCEGGQFYTKNVIFAGDTDIDFLQVKVNNEVWERIESIYDADPDGKQYVCKTSFNKGIDLIFGNNQFGRAIQPNDQIEVTYLLHSGEMGNLDLNDDIFFTFEDELKDISGELLDGNSVFRIILADDDLSVGGGTYSETIDQVQEMIGFNSRAMVLANSDNYKTFINRFSFCGYHRTWSEMGSLVVNSLILKNYDSQLKEGKDYFELNESDFLLSESQKASVQSCIANSGQQLAGVVHRIYDPEICKYALYVYVKMKSTAYDPVTVEMQIKNLVGNFMAHVQSDIFIPKSDIVQLLKNNIDAIDGVDVYFLSEKNESAIINHQYTKKTTIFNPSTGLYETIEEQVFVGDGEDPGVGLDEHGNIYLANNEQFPVLMGGWKFISSKSDTSIQTTNADAITIVFKN